MATKLIILSFFLILSLTSTIESKSNHFDYILLATEWPETFCEHNKCTKHQDRWLIHGSWPENNDGTYPQFCSNQHPYNHELIKPILNDLIENWKTLKADSSNDQFWSHEYNKHGTCATECPLMKDQFSYFKSTLDAFKKLRIEQWLADAGIKPTMDKAFSLESFQHAIEKGLGHKVQIQCQKRSHEYPIVSQINFCLSKEDLSPFDCRSNNRGCSSKIGYLPTH